MVPTNVRAVIFSNSDLEASGLPQGRELEILQKFKGRIPAEVFTAEYNPPSSDGSGNIRDNLHKAITLLEAAGYKMGPDGVRVNAQGQRLSFEIIDAKPGDGALDTALHPEPAAHWRQRPLSAPSIRRNTRTG